jgi:ribosomal-protein-alanine N-acetyltransferase
MEIRTRRLILRPFRAGDASELAAAADERGVWVHLRDRFPHPYRIEDAEQWIRHAGDDSPPTNLAITSDGRVIGGVGLERRSDVTRYSGEIGYWLGVEHWGRGLATEAVAAFVDYVFSTFPVERLEAWVFAPNVSSRRVLEKCGFRLEGIARRGVYKDRRFLDSCLYGRLRED